MAAMASDSPSLLSLAKSLALVQPAAVPAVLDCLLASSSIFSAPALFSSLLGTFFQLSLDIRDVCDANLTNSHQRQSLIPYAAALFHLAKNPGSYVSSEAFEEFIRRGVLPLLSSPAGDNNELLDPLVDFLRDALAVRQCWSVMTSIVIPVCLKSALLFLELTQRSELYMHNIESVEQTLVSLTVASRILNSLVGVALGENSNPASEVFLRNLTWDLSLMTHDMLLHSSDRRSEAIRLIFPIIFKVTYKLPLFDVYVVGELHNFSRARFLEKLWGTCASMFSLGNQERMDAYNLISLHLSLLPEEGLVRTQSDNEYNLGEDDRIWNEIRVGLVDKNAWVRKHSLYILKKILQHSNCVVSRCQPPSQSVSIGKTLGVAASIEEAEPCSKSSRRGKWAEKEAKSMGVCDVSYLSESGLNRWSTFFLLYEMLEEYGTHLVEAAWGHQMSLFFQSAPSEGFFCVDSQTRSQDQMETSDKIFKWLAILWERGLFHANPQVRCLIMHSFLSMDWKSRRYLVKYVPKEFVLRPFILGLNDPIHHGEFGLGGEYTSKAIEGATDFIYQFALQFCWSERIEFVFCLASVCLKESFGRAGLMAFASCLSSASLLAVSPEACETADHGKKLVKDGERANHEGLIDHKISELLDIFRVIIEGSKQHFNPKYRLEVCERIMDATSAMVHSQNLPLETVLHFVSAFPREFIDMGGILRRRLQQWLHSNSSQGRILRQLFEFPKIFVKSCNKDGYFDDEDLDAWFLQAQKWAKLLFVMVKDDDDLETLNQVIQDLHSKYFFRKALPDLLPSKFLVIVMCVVGEVQQILLRKQSGYQGLGSGVTDIPGVQSKFYDISTFNELRSTFASLLDSLLSFSSSACSIFWSDSGGIETFELPSMKGRLGGPSQRRLALCTTSAVLQATLLVKTVASILSCSLILETGQCLLSSFSSLWDFCCKVVIHRTDLSEAGSELHMAAYESLASALKVFSEMSPPSFDELIMEFNESKFGVQKKESLLDPFLLSFLSGINGLLENGTLTRSRRAVLLTWKWLSLDTILSIPYSHRDSVECRTGYYLFSDASLRITFSDIVESLTNAGEASVLPLFRCIRTIVGMLHWRMCREATPCVGFNADMIKNLLESAWILYLSCNKRRIAPIAALLSSLLHPLLFSDLAMHEMSCGNPGPVKWFVQKILEEGTKSPRTLRLAALHLTGLWYSYPRTIKYYLKELKLLSLHGSVAFDEDFAAELSENQEAVFEISMLAKVPNSELAEVFINSEMYSRAAVAALFDKLGSLASNSKDLENNDDGHHACLAGKIFLMDLLDFAVNDKEIAKELYKKQSAIHRRKVRAWQILCVLSSFIDQDVVAEVSSKIHICLQRNNLPTVRQYLEMFAIQIYFKFPSLVEEQLLPIFHDSNIRPQAQSSYVFIAANIILHAGERALQLKHLNSLLPPIIPLLTSHHHSLRGFSQLLVYQVLCKLMPTLETGSSHGSIEKKCFEELKTYLASNVDCLRLRASMEGILDSFDPRNGASAIGIFNARNEVSQFECIPITLMEQVITFLNDVREELRNSMARDAMVIKNESFEIKSKSLTTEKCTRHDNDLDINFSHSSLDSGKHFQKKITLNKFHSDRYIPQGQEFQVAEEKMKLLSDMEAEDQLFCSALQLRHLETTQLKISQQSIILVASLIDRIPNLAGLARTCEIFRASALAIADLSVLQDKQFQLISVTADKWVPIIEVAVCDMKGFLNKKKHEGYSVLGLEQTTNSITIDRFSFPKKTVLVLGHEKEGIPVDIINSLDACLEIPQLGVVRSLNVHVSGAIALWEYTRQQRSKS
ncbi:tRNA/rRNA methyltransferase (SpoU) family protein [Wolffia australiana]